MQNGSSFFCGLGDSERPLKKEFRLKSNWIRNSEIERHQTFEDGVYWENREKTAVLGRWDLTRQCDRFAECDCSLATLK